jgi:hypothetical protein
VRPIESLCDSFFIFFALWTVIWIAAYSANLAFSDILPLFFAAIGLSVFLLAFKAPVVHPRTPKDTLQANKDTVTVLVFVFVGILLTLFLHRPDADDQLYLGMAVSLLAYPDLPIQQLPGYGAGVHDNNFNGIPAYEPLKAMVSLCAGLPLLDSYYLLVPSLMSALTVIVTCRLLRKLIPDGWHFGMLFFFVVMLVWGDMHRTLANFGFVRMFQGKAVLVSLVVPALFLYVFLVRDKLRSRPYYLFLVASVLISGVGFSRGGLVIGPLVLVFLGLACIEYRDLGRLSKILLGVTGFSTAVLIIVAYQSGWTVMNPEQLVYTPRGDVASTTNAEMLEFTMGAGFRGFFLLSCVGLGFLFIENATLRNVYRNYLTIFFLLLLVPWTSEIFAKILQQYLSWRWLWIVPVPALASVAVGGATAKIRRITNFGVAVGAFLVVTAGFTASSPRLVLSKENYASVRWPNAKIDSETIYLRPYDEKAIIKNGRLKLEGFEKGL